MSTDHETEYDDAFVAGLEWIWGEGFLSPGGPEEVAEILSGLDIAGARGLDVGCGLGGIDLLLVLRHGAGRVIGLDVEPALIARARAAAAKAGLTERVDFRLVAPGPLPLDDDAFDLVFSKDAMLHIPDKAALFAEVFRVLRPGGVFAAGDWLFGGERPYSRAMTDWLSVINLTFDMETPANTAAALEAAGFVEVATRDRNAWYREEVRREVARTDATFEQLAAAIGREAAEHRRRSNRARLGVVDNGDLRPTHLRARKPG